MIPSKEEMYAALEERHGKEYISKGSDIDYIMITVNAGSIEIN